MVHQRWIFSNARPYNEDDDYVKTSLISNIIGQYGQEVVHINPKLRYQVLIKKNTENENLYQMLFMEGGIFKIPDHSMRMMTTSNLPESGTLLVNMVTN